MNFSKKIERRAAAALPKHKGATPQRDPSESLHMKDTINGPAAQPEYVKEGSYNLNPAQAARILRDCSYERNRSVSSAAHHVATLAELMRRGRWLPKDQISFVRLPCGKLTLINGHHRMAAQAQSGVNIEWSVVIHECENEADIERIYTRYDTNLRRRSDNNILNGAGFMENHGIRADVATGLFRAAPIIFAGLSMGRTAKEQSQAAFARRIVEDRLEIAERYVRQARVYQDLLAPGTYATRRRLLAGGVMSVAMVTLTANEATARDFWGAIAEDDGLRRGDPRGTFLTWLRESNGKSKPVAASMYAAAKSWNYFAQGKRLQMMKIMSTPIVLYGTAYRVAA